MLADRNQLLRWHRLLSQTLDPAPVDGEQLAGEVANATGRRKLVAMLRLIDARQRGVDVPAKLTLPPIPKEKRPAAEGSLVVSDVWTAYTLFRLDEPSAADWLMRMIELLSPTALNFTPEDNPEPWWLHEMMILHALHSFALRTGDPHWLARTLTCADFHLQEIQPDHATNEPWAIHAYACHPDGNVTAETLLHAGLVQNGGVYGPAAKLISHDAASALAAYLEA